MLSELLEGLQKKGFRIDFNYDGSGFLMKAYERGGGYYLGAQPSLLQKRTRAFTYATEYSDVGASQLIIDGKIKLKNDSLISHFEEDGIVFENGSKLPADVVIYATG